eukprot:gene29260-36280_t
MPPDRSKFTLVIDRTDAAPYSGDTDFFKYFIGEFAKLYPHCISKTIVYPANLIFYSVFSIVKWFLDEHSRDNTILCVYESGVQLYIDEKYVPSTMGGKCTYEFNSDDFLDPYPEELVLKTLEERERGIRTELHVEVAQGVPFFSGTTSSIQPVAPLASTVTRSPPLSWNARWNRCSGSGSISPNGSVLFDADQHRAIFINHDDPTNEDSAIRIDGLPESVVFIISSPKHGISTSAMMSREVPNDIYTGEKAKVPAFHCVFNETGLPNGQ